MPTLNAITAPAPAAIDALHRQQATALAQAVGIVLFATLTAFGAQVRIYLWEVPITLQTIFIYGGGLCLGGRNGLLAALLYLAAGLVLPVYAGDGFGLSHWMSAPSAGYLLGMPLAALVAGSLARRWNTGPGRVLALTAGSLALFACGVVWLHFAAGHASWLESLDKGFFRFVTIDAAKILCVAALYQLLRRLG